MIQTFDIALALSSFAVFGAFVWAMRKHFVTDKVPTGAKVISAVSLVAFLTVLHELWAQTQPLWAHASGLLVQAASAVLFASAIAASRTARLTFAFDTDEPRLLVTGGPFRWVRHPFHASYILFWAGCAVATLSPLCAALLACLAVVYGIAARAEETKFSRSRLSADYAAYRRRAGLFWPRLGGSDG